MRGYSAYGVSESGTATKTAVAIIGSTTARPALYDIIVGSLTTPADVAIRAAASRFTAVGTAGSAFTPVALDSGDVASVTTAGVTHSAEPTYTATQDLVAIPFNQRATFRWVAAPGYELKGPASANNGIGVRLVSAGSAAVLTAGVHFFE
jgi:hypothetical protein